MDWEGKNIDILPSEAMNPQWAEVTLAPKECIETLQAANLGTDQ